jgi:hypothetical protein
MALQSRDYYDEKDNMIFRNLRWTVEKQSGSKDEVVETSVLNLCFAHIHGGYAFSNYVYEMIFELPAEEIIIPVIKKPQKVKHQEINEEEQSTENTVKAVNHSKDKEWTDKEKNTRETEIVDILADTEAKKAEPEILPEKVLNYLGKKPHNFKWLKEATLLTGQPLLSLEEAAKLDLIHQQESTDNQKPQPNIDTKEKDSHTNETQKKELTMTQDQKSPSDSILNKRSTRSTKHVRLISAPPPKIKPGNTFSPRNQNLTKNPLNPQEQFSLHNKGLLSKLTGIVSFGSDTEKPKVKEAKLTSPRNMETAKSPRSTPRSLDTRISSKAIQRPFLDLKEKKKEIKINRFIVSNIVPLTNGNLQCNIGKTLENNKLLFFQYCFYKRGLVLNNMNVLPNEKMKVRKYCMERLADDRFQGAGEMHQSEEYLTKLITEYCYRFKYVELQVKKIFLKNIKAVEFLEKSQKQEPFDDYIEFFIYEKQESCNKQTNQILNSYDEQIAQLKEKISEDEINKLTIPADYGFNYLKSAINSHITEDNHLYNDEINLR